MNRMRLVLVGLLAGVTTGCSGMYAARDYVATAPTPPLKQCLMSPLDQTQIIDDKTLLITDQFQHAALMHMRNACLFDRNEAVAIKYFGTSEICGRMDVDITGGALTGIPSPCLIESLTPLSKDEARAYLNGKPKT